MYDYYLGGKDNYAVDRAAAEQFIAIVPGIRQMAQANRAFLVRAVESLARSGVGQFLDIGSGLPTRQNVHEVAQRVAPGTRVVYVDNDEVVLTHGRAMLENNPDTHVVHGDMRRPEELLSDPEITALIDFGRPAAVMLVSMLHFIEDDDLVAAIVKNVRERLAPGGYLVISHAYAGAVDAATEAAGKGVYRASSAGGIASRDPARLAELLDGMELAGPGIVPVQLWSEAPGEVLFDLAQPAILGVVARR
ncbi:SAM-dependent methyltransferase [Nonomuraea sp. NN258]|nr:SAM-dependent methyltransferase [Nonomuraea antri]